MPSARAHVASGLQVGMQNSALGALLATLHFPDPLTPVPCAISACTHSIVGSGIAAYWRLTDAGHGTGAPSAYSFPPMP